MKQMQAFRDWLSVSAISSTPMQRRLAAVTRLTRSRLLEATDAPWFMWEAPAQSAAV